MTIVFDAPNGVWVAMGAFEGRPYLAEGATPGEAFNNAVACAQESARAREVAA
jgi:hypothetical protein